MGIESRPMNSLIRQTLIAAALCGSAVIAQARIERVVEKTFAVNGAGTLRVETQGGEIRITPSSDSVVHITAKQKIRADDDRQADELLKKLELTIEQTGNDVRIVSKYERQPSGFHFGSWPPVNVDVIVSLPANFATDLHTSGGAIIVGDMNGKAELHTSGGNLKLGKMGGPVDAHTSGGSITLDQAEAAVELKTSGGNITVGRVAGRANLETSGGSIKIESVSRMLRAHTSGGSIRANFSGPLSDDCLLDTAGGSVHVTVDKAAAFKLDASTSGGSVDAQGLTLTLETSSKNRGKLVGAVNGGGPLLRLHSSGGSIVVRTI
jgi:hypothetical protein